MKAFRNLLFFRKIKMTAWNHMIYIPKRAVCFPTHRIVELIFKPFFQKAEFHADISKNTSRRFFPF